MRIYRVVEVGERIGTSPVNQVKIACNESAIVVRALAKSPTGAIHDGRGHVIFENADLWNRWMDTCYKYTTSSEGCGSWGVKSGAVQAR